MEMIMQVVRYRVQRFAILSAALLVIVGLSCATLQAQTELGTIAGTVTDAKAGAMPNAEVVVSNEGTGITNKTTTNGSGEFVVPNLVPGSYTVTVSVSGFKTVEQKGVQLQVLSLIHI